MILKLHDNLTTISKHKPYDNEETDSVFLILCLNDKSNR